MMVKIDPELKDRLARLARMEGKTTSQIVRELIENYVEDRDIGPYIDDLWKRIGRKISAKGVGPADVGKIISITRKERAKDEGRR